MEKIINDLTRVNAVISKIERDYRSRGDMIRAISSFRRLGYNFFWISVFPDDMEYKLRVGIMPGEITREFYYTFMLDQDDQDYINRYINRKGKNE